MTNKVKGLGRAQGLPWASGQPPSGGQGTLEYLVIIGIVVVLSLVVVGLVMTQVQSGSSVSSTASQISSKTGLVSLTNASLNSVDGNYFVNIKNNDSDTIIVTSVQVGNDSNSFSQQLNMTSEKTFKVPTATTCVEGQKTSANVTINYTSKEGLAKNQLFSGVVINCERVSVDPAKLAGGSGGSVPVSDSSPPTITLYLPLDNNMISTSDSNTNFIFSFSDDSTVSDCNLYIDNVLVDSNNSLMPSDTNVTLDGNVAFFGSGDQSWDVNCSDASGNKGSATDRNINYTPPEPEVQFSATGGTITYDGDYTIHTFKNEKIVTNSIDGNDGIATQQTANLTTSKIEKALNFDGGSDWVSVPSFSTGGSLAQLTISSWIYPTADNCNNGIISHDWTLMVISFDGCSTNTGNRVGFRTHGGTGDDDLYASESLPMNEWTLVTLTYDGSNRYIYYNTRVVASDAYTGSVDSPLGTIEIGRYYGGYNFPGSLDDIRIYSKYLAPSDINSLYNFGSGTETEDGNLGTNLLLHYKMNDDLATTNVIDSLGDNNGTSIRNTNLMTTSKIGKALNFNGTSDFVLTPPITLVGATTPLSYALWVYFNAANGYDRPFNSISPTYGNHMFIIGNDAAAANKLYAYTENNGITAGGQAFALATTNTGQWYHVVGVQDPDNTEVRLYINGTYQSTTTNIADGANVNAGFALGGSYNGGAPGTFINGHLDDVRIYSRVLTENEITSLYNSGSGTESEDGSLGTNLVAHYKMNDDANATQYFNVTSGTRDANVLVVAGGGGGSFGGGGAGGLIFESDYNANGIIPITIGAGGEGSIGSIPGQKGSNSIFNLLTAIGGGGGGAGSSVGQTGGSGGGGGGNDLVLALGGTTEDATQGNDGGSNAPGGPPYASGGGGGAGGAGENAVIDVGGGDGGIGAQYDVSGENNYYAAGGGGGTHTYPGTEGMGGSGIGGNGNSNGYSGTNAVINTGSGGGGGGGWGDYGGDGSSGIVIVRYLS